METPTIKPMLTELEEDEEV
jgi:hypothetical protein